MLIYTPRPREEKGLTTTLGKELGKTGCIPCMVFESNNNKIHQHIHTGFPMSISMRVQSLEIPSALVHHLSVLALQPFDPCINNSIIPLNPRHQSSFLQHHHYTHHSRQPPSFASDHPVRSSSSSKLLRLSPHQPTRAKTRGIEIHDEK